MNHITTSARTGVNVGGLAVMVLGAVFAVGVGLVALLLTWRGVLPGFFALGVFPLALGSVSLLTSGLHRSGNDEERMDQWLGVSLQGEAQAAARAAYADLLLDE
ncbi:hypothetical protein QZM81_19525 [Burkholderia cepacia]|uniref:hypothetical protein n=1 Tax=Burkholderia cepacia TaxID=292 RepID=UPI00264E623B|nr:hypothetical protein [Burkholderia cepacia]MDN7857998.1 hypothetical protein [Burkholderia cepacia]